MIDNFDIISTIMSGKVITDDTFFLVQVIRRHKDEGNEDMNANNIVVENFFISNERELEEKKARIIKTCELNNARAYIRLNKRSYKKVALKALALMAETIANGNYQVKNSYLSACGSYAEERTFLLDIDYVDVNFDLNEMENYIGELLMEARKKAYMHRVPTKNGYHIICSGFNTEKFRMKYPNVSIHKDNPTILYVP